MKNILIIYYTQFGQTKKMVDLFKQGLDLEVNVSEYCIKPKNDYPVPWKMNNFFNVMPDCIVGKTPEIEPIPEEILVKDYDYVVMAYQVWFLSPSLPIQALLKEKSFQTFLNDKKVLNLISCRNMWYSAVKKFNKSLENCSVSQINNFVLCDKSPGWANFITTPRWMLTGKKNAFWFFPEAGISNEEFARCLNIGKILKSDNVSSALENLSHHEKDSAVLMESIGHLVFLFWGNIIHLVAGQNKLLRSFLLVFFRVNLVALIVVLLPLSEIFLFLSRPFLGKKFDRKLKLRLSSR